MANTLDSRLLKTGKSARVTKRILIMTEAGPLQTRRNCAKHQPICALIALLLASGSLNCVASDYFVRPYLNFSGGATIDGLMTNGPTSGDEFFSDGSRTGSASVDIGTGEVAPYAQMVTFDDGFVQVATVMSDTFCVKSGAGTDFSFEYRFAGDIDADAKSIVEDPGTYLILVNAAIGIFRPGVAEWNNWAGQSVAAQRLFYDSFSYSVSNPDEEISDSIDDFLSFNTVLTSDFEQFQVFLTLELIISTTTPQTVTLDFSNTGILEFTADPLAEVCSDSGAFPNTMPVPEPASGLLALMGLGILTIRRRRV